MISLSVSNLHWIEPGDQPSDMCVHGNVELTVDGHVLSSPKDGAWCVSAAAIHLLRTLTASHTHESPVAEHLIPCCGHFMIPSDAEDGDVTFMGCNQGVDWQIIHCGDSVGMVLPDGHTTTLSARDWRVAVTAFADTIRKFYADSLAKAPSDDWEERGFNAMMAEWDRRRCHASDVAYPINCIEQRLRVLFTFQTHSLRPAELW